MPKNRLIHQRKESNTELSKIIDDDITYSVLLRILKTDCTDIFHNNGSVIVCYSEPPYPIGVFCKDENDCSDIDSVSECIKSCFPLENGYNVIMSYGVLEALKKRDCYFHNAELKMELRSYKLESLNEVNYHCGGEAKSVDPCETENIAHLLKDMSYEMEGFIFDIEECRKKAARQLKKTFTIGG